MLKKLKIVFEVARLRGTINFMVIDGMGILMAGRLSVTKFPDIIYIILAEISIILIWVVSVLVNDVYDLEIDKITNASKNRPLVTGYAKIPQYLQLSVLFSAIILFISYLIGRIVPIFIITILTVIIIYSKPPFRLRNNIIMAPVLIGFATLMVYLVGYFAGDFTKDITIKPFAFQVGSLILLYTTLIITAKDYKDYEGDCRNNVKTIFTAFGINKGKIIVSALVFLTFLTGIIVLQHPLDLLIFLIFGVTAACDFKIHAGADRIFILSLLWLMYINWRIITGGFLWT